MTMGPRQIVLLLLAASGAFAAERMGSPEIMSTTDCSVVRNEPYRARLDITYLYLVEWQTDSEFESTAIEQAVATGLVEMLDECDFLGRPKYSVLISRDGTGGQEQGVCSTLQDDGSTDCRVLKGMASILFDTDIDAVEQLAYFVIGRALNDLALLEDSSRMNITRTELLQPISDTLVILTNVTSGAGYTGSMPTDTSTVVKAALASAAISFALTVGIAYIMYIRRRDDSRESKSRLFRLQSKHRRFFHELLDEGINAGLEPGWMVADSDMRSPSITWSVSDLTIDSIDDSQSIRSSLPLDRIVEALSDEEMASNESTEPPSRKGLHPTGHDIRFVPHWDGNAMGYPDEGKSSAQFVTPPHGRALRSMSMSDAAIADESLSVSPVSLLSAELVGVEREMMQDLDSITISLEGCRYLENDVETSDEVDCSFNSDPVHGLDVKPCSLSLIGYRNDGKSATADDDLLFSDDDLDMMEVVEEFEQVWTVPDNHGQTESGIEAETDLATRCSNDETSERQLSLLQMLERAKTQRLLTYSD